MQADDTPEVCINPMDDRAVGLSHALGHKLGAAYGIPHGITSVSTFCVSVHSFCDIWY